MNILDEKVFLVLMNHMNNIKIAFVMKFIAVNSSSVFWFIYCTFVLYLWITKDLILLPFLLGPALSLLSVIVIRRFVNRKRPFEIMGFEPLIKHETGSSFPSKHGTSAFAIAIAMMWVHPLLGCIGILLAVLTGISRVMVGVHYPSDIMGGVLIAIFLSQLTYFLAFIP